MTRAQPFSTAPWVTGRALWGLGLEGVGDRLFLQRGGASVGSCRRGDEPPLERVGQMPMLNMVASSGSAGRRGTACLSWRVIDNDGWPGPATTSPVWAERSRVRNAPQWCGPSRRRVSQDESKQRVNMVAAYLPKRSAAASQQSRSFGNCAKTSMQADGHSIDGNALWPGLFMRGLRKSCAS